MFDAIETAARLGWEVRPNISSLGNEAVFVETLRDNRFAR